MILHQDENNFKIFISATAQSLGLREIYIEKDYWVTLILKRLSNSAEFKDKVIFKGGTALSKAFQIIDRFSEDVDLAVITEGMSNNQIQKLIKAVEKQITMDVQETTIEGITRKGSKFRKTVHEYNKVTDGTQYGQALDKVLVEINSFTTPSPHSPQEIASYIGEFLVSTNRVDLVQRYELEAFSLLILNVERTLVEKILGLIRASYKSTDELKNKIRHIYDIEKIMKVDGIIEFIYSPAFFDMINLVKKDDARNSQFNGDWLQNRMSENLLFNDIDEIWSALESTYNKEFKSLVHGELPDSKAIKRALNIILTRLKEYDKQ